MAAIQLTPAANHVHCAEVNAAGNGTSTLDAGHQHQVVGWRVYPVAGHTHTVAQLQSGQAIACGAPGKPCNCGRK